jgi:hypothetical protein
MLAARHCTTTIAVGLAMKKLAAGGIEAETVCLLGGGAEGEGGARFMAWCRFIDTCIETQLVNATVGAKMNLRLFLVPGPVDALPANA